MNFDSEIYDLNEFIDGFNRQKRKERIRLVHDDEGNLLSVNIRFRTPSYPELRPSKIIASEQSYCAPRNIEEDIAASIRELSAGTMVVTTVDLDAGILDIAVNSDRANYRPGRVKRALMKLFESYTF